MKRNKVICPCYKVTKGDIADAVSQGAEKFKDVKPYQGWKRLRKM